MSNSRIEKIKCPQCGKELEFRIWASVESDTTILDEGPRTDDIISGELFALECEGCGFKTLIPYPIVFNDKKHNAHVYMTQPEGVEECLDEINRAKYKAGSKVRVVTTLSAFREKVMLFTDGLDDRLLEIAKLVYVLQNRETMEANKVDAIYYDSQDGTRKFALIAGENEFFAMLDDAYFKLLEDNFGKKLKKYGQDDYLVDAEWAMDFLNDMAAE